MLCLKSLIKPGWAMNAPIIKNLFEIKFKAPVAVILGGSGKTTLMELIARKLNLFRRNACGVRQGRLGRIKCSGRDNVAFLEMFFKRREKRFENI